jgi:conjugal transfer/entry exclusion protein
MLRFANKLGNLEDSRKIDNERVFIMRKIDEVQNEIFQLENNIQFFQNAKNAKKENSIVTEVRKNIERHKEELQTWKEKLVQIKNLNN